jgi:hypothetical protein
MKNKTVYVLITASDIELEELCYLPLKSGYIYKAFNSEVDGVIYNTYYDVICNKGIVRGVYNSRLKVLSKSELREVNLNKLLVI